MEEKENLTEQNKNEKKEDKSIKFYLIGLSFLYILSLILGLSFISKKENIKKYTKEIIDSKKIIESVKNKNYVAIVPIYGAIYQENSSSSFYEKGSQSIADKIERLGNDKKIKAIVLDINSPGGSVGAVQEIYSVIKKVKNKTKKPFVARFGEVSASGGYYVASACDEIIAHSGTITGSIGVIFNTSNIEDLFKKIGVKSEAIKSGKYKDIGSMTRPMTKEEKKILQDMIDDSYEIFLGVVSEGRKIEKNKLREIADGRIFTGNQALKVGLVDKLGDLQDAIDEAGILANIGKNPPVIKGKKYVFEDIFEFIDSKTSILPMSKSLNAPLLEYRWEGIKI